MNFQYSRNGLMLPRRDLILGALAAGVITADQAQAATAFTSYPFRATGTPFARTMPERLSEFTNVKEYGNIGSGQDATSAFQAAFDAAIPPGGTGRIWMPAGTYTLTQPINFNQDYDFGLEVFGAGNATNITGTFAGPLFNRSLGTPNNTYGPRIFRNLRMANTHASGICIRLGSTIGATCQDLIIQAGLTCITTEDAPGFSSQAVCIENCFPSSAQTNNANSIAFVHGGSGRISVGDILGFNKGLVIYGGGLTIDGSRMERCGTGIELGCDPTGTERGLYGFCLTTMLMEGHTVFIHIRGLTVGASIGPVAMTGHDITNSGVTNAEAATTYGLKIDADKLFASELMAISSGQYFDTAAIHIGDYTERAYVMMSACVPTVGGGTGVPWRIPTTARGFDFDKMCNIDPSQNAPDGNRFAFAGLPPSGQRQEGDRYWLYDANTVTIGANVTAGGSSGRCRVAFDGTNWVCVGP